MEKEPSLIECLVMLSIAALAWLFMSAIWFVIFVTCQDLNALTTDWMQARMQASKAKRD